MSTYLRPTAPIAPRVLLTPNPAEAMALAQRVIQGPLMSNHSHGLWGYSGPTEHGFDLTIQSTGIGGPSAVAVLFELAELGVRSAIHVGRARPLNGGVAAAARIVVAQALRADGASQALGEGSAMPDAALTRSLRGALGAQAVVATVLSRDLNGRAGLSTRAHPRAGEALVSDLESAALLAAGEHANVAVAGALLAANGDAESSRGDLVELGALCAEALGREAAD